MNFCCARELVMGVWIHLENFMWEISACTSTIIALIGKLVHVLVQLEASVCTSALIRKLACGKLVHVLIQLEASVCTSALIRKLAYLTPCLL